MRSAVQGPDRGAPLSLRRSRTRRPVEDGPPAPGRDRSIHRRQAGGAAGGRESAGPAPGGTVPRGPDRVRPRPRGHAGRERTSGGARPGVPEAPPAEGPGPVPGRAVRARTPPGPGPGGAGAGAGSGAGAVRAAARGEPQDLRVVVADLVVELGVDPRDLVLGGAGGGSADQDVVERL